MNRLLEQQISQTKPGAVEAVGIRRSYAYDKAGQLVAIGDSRRGNLSYRYDPVGRLLEAHSRLGRETFAFDPAGNIGNPSDTDADTQAAGRVTTRVAVRLNGDGRSMAGRLMDNLLKDYAGTHYTWDERGNLVERSRNGEKTTFTWDGFNRMRSAETFGETTSFSYDALGRRIAKRSSHATNLFGWDGDTLAFESTQSIEGRQEYLGRGDSVHYIHEPGSFVPLVQIRQAQAVALSQTTDVKALIAANGGRYDIERDPLWNGQQLKTPQAFAKEEIAFYQCDHLGTPQELTDHEGRIAWSASYKAWGEAKQAISEAGRKAGFRNPIRFQGQYFDDETGLHYNRYRYYDPVSGRFVSKDPIGLSGGINLHTYAPSSIVWIDPLGLSGFQPKPLKTGSVYRNASGTADSMTPRPGVDDVRKGSRPPGLSAATSIDGLDSGKYVELDVAHACSCGLDVIHDKADGHVTIRPANDPNDEKLKSWSATRGTGKPHSYTEGLLGGVRSKGKK